MGYYNRDLKKFDQSNFEYLNEGKCAHVDYNHDIIFKQYFPHTGLSYRLKASVFDILKDIDNPHFIELIDIYANDKLLKLFFNKLSKDDFIVDAYSAKYYEDEKINVLNEPIDYLLDNIRELEILFGVFSDNAILTDDLHGENVIYTSQKMIIIDPDFFRLYNDSDLIIRNKKGLLKLLKCICEYMLERESKYTDEKIDNMANKLTDFKVYRNTDITYEVSRKPKGVKRPIEYLLK